MEGHSANGPNSSRLSASETIRPSAESVPRRLIERRLGVSVRAFCYPNGDVDDRVVRAVQLAGYRSAVSVEPGVNEPACDPYRLRRWFINEDRLAGPSGKASDTLLRMEICSLADRVFRRRRRRAVL